MSGKMTNDKPLVNRVARSGIVTLDLSEFYPKAEIIEFDISSVLFKGLLLKEKDFREFIKNHNWDQYQRKHLCVHCSTDAIIPMWAYMLIASMLPEGSLGMHVGQKKDLVDRLMRKNIENELNITNLDGKPVVLKGCSDVEIPAGIYAYTVELIRPFARSIMFGEPCSTVPVYKRPRKG
jgi:hypothetical protein